MIINGIKTNLLSYKSSDSFTLMGLTAATASKCYVYEYWRKKS